MLRNVDYIKSLSLILLPLSLVKTFHGHTTYFQIFYVLLGAYSFFKYKLFSKNEAWIIAVILIINACSSYFINNDLPLLKYAQLCSLFSLIWFIKDRYTNFDLIKYSKILALLSLSICIYNYWFEINHFANRSILGIHRVAGIVGEPNFSAFALTLPWIIFYRNKMYFWLIVSTIPLVWVQSRSIAIFFLIFITLEIIKLISKDLLYKVKTTLVFLFIISPFIVISIYKLANNDQKKVLINKLSTRFYLTEYYTKLGAKFPFGVGFSNGQNYYLNKGSDFRIEKKEELKANWIETAEQHSMYSQIFSEFGFVLYVFLVLGLLKLISSNKIYIPYYLLPSFSVLVFINGLTELTTILLLSFLKISYNSLETKD